MEHVPSCAQGSRTELQTQDRSPETATGPEEAATAAKEPGTSDCAEEAAMDTQIIPPGCRSFVRVPGPRVVGSDGCFWSGEGMYPAAVVGVGGRRGRDSSPYGNHCTQQYQYPPRQPRNLLQTQLAPRWRLLLPSPDPLHDDAIDTSSQVQPHFLGQRRWWR